MARPPHGALAAAVLVGLVLAVEASFVIVTDNIFSHRMFVMEGPACAGDDDIHRGCQYNRRVSAKMTSLFDTWCDEAKTDKDEDNEERYCNAENRKRNYDFRVASMRSAPTLFKGDEEPLSMVKAMGNYPAAGFALQYQWKNSRFGSSSGSQVEGGDSWTRDEDKSLYGLYGVTNEAQDEQYHEAVEYFQNYPMHPYCARVGLRAAIYLNRRMRFSEGHAVFSAVGSVFGTTENNMWKVDPTNMVSRAVKKKDSGVCWAWANPAQKLLAKLHIHYRPDVDYDIYRDPKVDDDAKLILNRHRPVLDAMPFLCNFRRSEIDGTVERARVPDLPEYSDKLGDELGLRDSDDYEELLDMKRTYDSARRSSGSTSTYLDAIISSAGWTCSPRFWDEGASTNKNALTCDCVCGIWDPDCGRRETKKKVYCHSGDEEDSFERPEKGRGYLTRHCTLAVTATASRREKAFYPSCSKSRVFEPCQEDGAFGGCSSFKEAKKI